jgi:hypothetical protein
MILDVASSQMQVQGDESRPGRCYPLSGRCRGDSLPPRHRLAFFSSSWHGVGSFGGWSSRGLKLSEPGIHIHPRASPHLALDFLGASSYSFVKCASLTHLRRRHGAVSRLDLRCENRGSDLASRPDPDWQTTPTRIPHGVAGSWLCSRARLSIPCRCSPIDHLAYDRVFSSPRSRLTARALCPLRPRSTSALVRHRFCALPAPPDRAGCRRAQTTGGGAR